MSRISSLDAGYRTGQLSLYPLAKDDPSQLYNAKNLSDTVLRQSLAYNGKYLIVADTSAFPSSGLLRVGPSNTGEAELIYYGATTPTQFQNLIRGFAGSRQSAWSAGVGVTSGVMAEAHNAVKDAVQQIEVNLGVRDFPAEASLNGILKQLETTFLAPKPLFRASPLSGPPPLRVRFQNFSNRGEVRYLWDFGDGTTSIETNPIHTYLTEGAFTVSMNLITQTAALGIATKSNYITVSNDAKPPFFYVSPIQGDSVQRANSLSIQPTTFNFVDQTDGNISQRYWIFDDGDSLTVDDPNNHTATHVYQKPGNYSPSLLIVFANQALKRAFLTEKITVF